MTPGRFAEIVGWITEELEGADRDPGAFGFCVSLPTLVFDDDDEWAQVRAYHWGHAHTYLPAGGGSGPRPINRDGDAEFRRTTMVGPSQLVIDRIRGFAEVVDGRFEFHARLVVPGLPAARVVESMQRFADEVMTAFR